VIFSLLTLFTIPKPFEGHIGTIQRNAIRSWKSLDPECEIILFGDERGTLEAAAELDTAFRPQIERNEYGTPLVDSLFLSASQKARYSTLCYVNADIILMSDFIKAFQRVKELAPFLMVGRRWELPISRPLDFTDPSWEEGLRSEVLEKGRLFPYNWIDYFVFNRELWGNSIPPFAVGRTAWDCWFIYKARKLKASVIDATPAIMAIHQSHHYDPARLSHDQRGKWEGPEVPRNMELAGKYAVNYTIADAGYVLGEQSLSKRGPVVRTQRFLTTHFPATARGAVKVLKRSGFYGSGGNRA
jgi:hypothetical protein